MKNIFKIAIGVGIITTVTGLLIKKVVDHKSTIEEDDTPDKTIEIEDEIEESLPEHLMDRHEKIMADLEELVGEGNYDLHDELEKIRQENLADFDRMSKVDGVKSYMDISHDIYERTKLFFEEFQKEDMSNE